MKRGDEKELERKLRLEKVVARMAVEMEEERRARLENGACYQTSQFGHGDGRRKKSMTGEDGSYQTTQVGHGDGRRKNSKTGEDGGYHTIQVGPGDRGRKKSKKLIGYDLGLIQIEIGVLKMSRNELACPVM